MKNSVPDLIGSLYSAALDERRFNTLIAHAESALANGVTETAGFDELRQECEKHIAQAEELLATLPGGEEEERLRPVFFTDQTAKILNPNRIAEDLFGIEDGDGLGLLLPDSGVLQKLCRFAGGRTDHAPVLRLNNQRTGRPVVMIVEASGKAGLARVAAMDALWHENAARATQVLYGLTASETEVLGLLTDGHSPAETARLRGRSVETVRQQIRAIIQKLEADGMQEAVQLARAVAVSSRVDGEQHREWDRLTLTLPDGRSLEYCEQGSPAGDLVFFLHGCLGGVRLPQEADRVMRRTGIRMVAPARPWHGQTSGNPLALDQPDVYAEDLKRLASHLNARQFSIVAYDVGVIFALTAASHLNDHLKSVLCVAAQPPMRSLSDFATAPQQQRIFAILARISPPLLRYLAVLGDRKLKKEGAERFARTVFGGARADLSACEDPEVLELMWTGHHFHVENGSDGFINDCRMIASNWLARVGQIEAPVHFLHGTEDASIHAERIKALAATVGGEISWVEEAGHTLPFSHWQHVISQLRRTESGL
ncbi:alpha/beta fold hydrolase [Roseibium aggregatum]|uniref:Alpha/beta fold hydrolase n=1 Tax=Roseibium aggregatum TaxID=187304 RepID=A0A939EHZ7_9HYPH|nr:alpha/beta fold hydrolase [Roseibium aggregatum]MBN9673547.1 alpha/beta fold hydrolase [Roseibium aggregatum]